MKPDRPRRPASDGTDGKPRGTLANLQPFKPGQSGNPAGRPKGSRNKLGQAFVEALYADFQQHGAGVIDRVRDEEPAQYLRVIAAVMPKQVNIERPLNELSDDELGSLLDVLRTAIAAEDGAGDGTEAPAGLH